MRHSLLLLGLVFACEDRPDKDSSDGLPTSAEPPLVWIEMGAGLPSGTSSTNNLEVKVTGNDSATHYQYALFSDKSVTCTAAKYGEFKAIDTHLTEISLGDNGTKILCIRGKDRTGNVQAEPKRYTWEKISALDELRPKAWLKIKPTACDDQIDSKVLGNSITKQYQYVFKEEKDFDCDGDDVSYETVATLANNNLKIEDLGNDGHKTLCLRGLNEDGTLRQTQATRETWEKELSALHAKGEQPDAGKAGLGLFCAEFTLSSGDDTGRGVTVKNIGSGVLRWKASVATTASWLAMKVGKDGSYAPIGNTGELARGELNADKS